MKKICLLILLEFIALFSFVNADTTTITPELSASKTRYFAMSSAMNLKKGEGFYQNSMIAFNSFNVGVTDNFSIGGGTELSSLLWTIFQGSFLSTIFITPKVGYQVEDNLHLGAGFVFITAPKFFPGFAVDFDTVGRHYYGVLYTNATYGNEKHNATIGMGYGAIRNEFSALPIVTISGMTRITDKMAFVTENWLLPQENYDGFFSYGVKFIGEKYDCDIAFINNSELAKVYFIGFPWINFVVKF
ncbi:MAG: hypothetical protein JNL36_00460 [Candidatus Kapabacteria bacterium]|jgi:hypothetical protein|nr:hypothetical protein [Candidatus Kapabacteria bacterium]